MVLNARMSLPCSRPFSLSRLQVEVCASFQAVTSGGFQTYISILAQVARGSQASVEFAKQCVGAAFGLLQGDGDGLLPREAGHHFLADDAFDRVLPPD
jgi:hypothetical protein